MPQLNSTMYHKAMSQGITLSDKGMGRSAVQQGGMQAAAMFVTLAVSIIGGLITG